MPTPSAASGFRLGAAAAFVAALALAFAASGVLAVVGAPPRLVSALAPLAVVAASVAFGLSLGAKTLPGYLAAGSRIGAGEAGLAFALALGAVGWALRAPGGALAWPMAIGGALLVALAVSGAWRGGALSDVLATAFPAWPLRAAFALAFFAVGSLTALAGIALGEEALRESLGAQAVLADAMIGAVLAASLAPGGGFALAWIDAACGAFVFALAAALSAFALARAPGGDALAAAGAAWPAPNADNLPALTLAVATFAPLALALGASGSPARASRIGFAGLAAFALAVTLFAVGAEALGGDGPGLRAGRAALALILALALARPGLFVALRAIGYDLATAPQVTANLASLRLARLRLCAIAFSALAAAATRRLEFPPETALTAALALSLALTAPSLSLSLWPRAGNAAAAVALFVGAANFARLFILPQSLADISLGLAGQGALAGLLAGAFVALVFPARRAQGDGAPLAFFE